MVFTKSAFFVFVLCGVISGFSGTDETDGHFSSWKDVPQIIDSIDPANCETQLEQLHQLTRIKLGYPQASVCLSKQDHQLYMLQTKRNWEQWWETTGKPVSELKSKDAKVDLEAFQLAREFLGTKQPPSVLPVWIPKTWTLYITYSNGDYGGKETEVWIIERQTSSASMSRLRVEREGRTMVGRNINSLEELDGFSIEQADRILKALCYVHRYAPPAGSEVANDAMRGTYYPHSTLRLRDGQNRVIWNTHGYDFSKSQPKFGDGESGRSYYFLNTAFPPTSKDWKSILKPTSEQLAPYRRLLKFCKPYHSSCAPHLVRLFADHGGNLERQAIIEWAEKQKAATNPKMDWKVCSHDFGTGAVVNILGFTRLALQRTVKELQTMEVRLKSERGGAASEKMQAKQKMLENYVANMLDVAKQEKEDVIQAFPQPLRDLVKAKKHPNDPNLKRLSAAIQAIRKKPDPRLFQQLIQEIHEGTLVMRSLLEDTLLNEHNILDLEPWGKAEEAVAVGACIDALHLAKPNARDDLVKIILHACGGGKIEIEGPHGGRSISLTLLENGSQMSLGSASAPLSMKDAKVRLRQLYQQSRGKSR